MSTDTLSPTYYHYSTSLGELRHGHPLPSSNSPNLLQWHAARDVHADNLDATAHDTYKSFDLDAAVQHWSSEDAHNRKLTASAKRNMVLKARMVHDHHVFIRA